jgi:LuxR family maltose regulon positive regulatory protein
LREEFEYLLWARLLIAQNQPKQALRLLVRLREAAAEGGRTGCVIEMLALEALAQQACGDTDQALTTLEQALALAEPMGYVRTFVDEGAPMAELLHQAASRGIAPDYAAKLLAAYEIVTTDDGRRTEPSPSSRLHCAQAQVVVGRPVSPRSEAERDSSVVEPLSRREREVLQLITAGLTNREIAQELTVATSTVKTHLKNIYAKLGVRNRTQAAAHARELNLL